MTSGEKARANPHGVIVFGASGSGTTTLGRELARVLDFAYFDIDDYFWEQTEVPFSAPRPREERRKRLRADITKHVNFVLSGSMTGWDEPFLPYLDLAVFVTAPAAI
jgi:cytidylate kinase